MTHTATAIREIRNHCPADIGILAREPDLQDIVVLNLSHAAPCDRSNASLSKAREALDVLVDRIPHAGRAGRLP